MINTNVNTQSDDKLYPFKEKKRVQKIVMQIRALNIPDKVKIMEVCGGHTHAIRHFGIPQLLPNNIELISGPGCPVCVTELSFINKAIIYARQNQTIIATYGDLIRVPGSNSTLEKEKANGADVRIVHSPLDILEIATNNPNKKVIFLAIGFETTAPGTALMLIKAKQSQVKNVFVLCAHKVMPPALNYVLNDNNVKINGLLAPGHVAAITGTEMFKAICEIHKVAMVVSGFEAVDILQSIYMVLQQISCQKPGIEIQYRRFVKIFGNTKAQEILRQVFIPKNVVWRGFGLLKGSGLALNTHFENYDAEKQLPIDYVDAKEPEACICGQVLRGIKKPTDCILFAKTCTPANPIGACMVSEEGGCHAYFKYNDAKLLINE